MHVQWVFINAGVNPQPLGNGMADVTPEIFNENFSVNTIGAFLVTQQLLKVGLIGGSTPTTVVYSSSALGSIGYAAATTAAGFTQYAYR